MAFLNERPAARAKMRNCMPDGHIQPCSAMHGLARRLSFFSRVPLQNGRDWGRLH